VKQVEVTILGQGYVLGCPPGGEAQLQAAVAQVDREMSAIRDAGKVKARERIAVLAALNLAWQMGEAGAAPAARAHVATSAAVAPPTAATAAKAGNPGQTSGPAAGPAQATDIDLDGLLRRIDAALGNDGQLL